MNLLSERIKYETDLAESRENRRVCYLTVMLMTSPFWEDPFFTVIAASFEEFLQSKETDFTVYDFDRVTKIFPKAKTFFDKGRFQK